MLNKLKIIMQTAPLFLRQATTTAASAASAATSCCLEFHGDSNYNNLHQSLLQTGQTVSIAFKGFFRTRSCFETERRERSQLCRRLVLNRRWRALYFRVYCTCKLSSAFRTLVECIYVLDLCDLVIARNDVWQSSKSTNLVFSIHAWWMFFSNSYKMG